MKWLTGKLDKWAKERAIDRRLVPAKVVVFNNCRLYAGMHIQLDEHGDVASIDITGDQDSVIRWEVLPGHSQGFGLLMTNNTITVGRPDDQAPLYAVTPEVR